MSGLREFDAERWGSWLELQVPDASYFADSRIEMIPASAWRDYVAVSEAQPGWEAVLDRWQVDALVLSRGDQPRLVAAIDSSGAWRIDYRDADGVVAIRARAPDPPAPVRVLHLPLGVGAISVELDSKLRSSTREC